MTPGKGGMESMCLDPHPNHILKKINKICHRVGRGEWEVAGVRGEWVMVGTRLGHLGGLLGRKSHAPCLLLPTVVPSFDCEAMNNASRMGLKKGGGRMEGWMGV